MLEKDAEKIADVFRREKIINQLHYGINDYMVKITNEPISESEHRVVTGLFHSVSDMERVGDHAENIAELAEIAITSGQEFTEMAIAEIKEITAAALESFNLALKTCATNNLATARQVLEVEQKVDEMEKTFRTRHIQRLTEERCTAMAGITFLDLLSNLERVSDHATNIASTTLEQTP